MTAFLDTGVLYGALDMSDERHMDAVSLVYHALKGRWGAVYTSNYVVVEATLLLASRVGRPAARAVPRFLGRSGFRELLVDKETHARAVELFTKDDRLSLTDASSVLLMKMVGAKAAMSFDERSLGGRDFDVVGAGHWDAMTDEEKEDVMSLESPGRRRGARTLQRGGSARDTKLL